MIFANITIIIMVIFYNTREQSIFIKAWLTKRSIFLTAFFMYPIEVSVKCHSIFNFFLFFQLPILFFQFLNLIPQLKNQIPEVHYLFLSFFCHSIFVQLYNSTGEALHFSKRREFHRFLL